MPPKSKVVSRAEVMKHNTEKDLWMVIHGKVYDITKFVDEHPGGVETLTDVAGMDGTAEFDSVGHSAMAKDQLEQYYVGTLSEEDLAAMKAEKKSTHNTRSSKMAVAFVVLLLALVLFLVKNQS